MELRPLGFGEIFDRAITLYIRNFVPFASIVMVLVVPLAILQYFLDLNSQSQLDALVRIFTHPERIRTEHVPPTFSSPASIGIFIALLLLTYAAWPFALNAVAVGVARLYRNLPVEFRVCYEVAFRRWLQIMGMIGITLLVFIGWETVAVVVVLFLSLAVGFFLTLTPVAFWVTFAIALIGILALLPSLAPLVVALTFSMYAAVIEERGVVESVVLGFSRVFNRSEFWRSLLFSIAICAVILGGSAVFGVIGLVAAFAHLPLLQSIIESLTRAVIAPFGVVLLAVYYFDVRIRREGFDLETSLERLTGATVA